MSPSKERPSDATPHVYACRECGRGVVSKNTYAGATKAANAAKAHFRRVHGRAPREGTEDVEVFADA